MLAHRQIWNNHRQISIDIFPIWLHHLGLLLMSYLTNYPSHITMYVILSTLSQKSINATIHRCHSDRSWQERSKSSLQLLGVMSHWHCWCGLIMMFWRECEAVLLCFKAKRCSVPLHRLYFTNSFIRKHTGGRVLARILKLPIIFERVLIQNG